MKESIEQLYSNPKYIKVIEWVRLLTITGSAQIMVQAVGLISGILVIRLLSTQEYALYTLANVTLGTMTVLADGGITLGIIAQGGKVWQDRSKLGVVLATGLDLRKRFAVVSLIISTPLLLFLLKHHGANWTVSILIALSIVPAFFTALSSNILQVPLKLQQSIVPLQKNQVQANVARLLLLVLTLFVAPWAFVAMFSAGLPQVWANNKLRKIASTYADWEQKPSLIVRQELLDFVKRILPGSIYYCISGQITIWLISVFGATSTVAQVGALGRLALLINLFNVLFSTLLVPRFARLPASSKLLLSYFIRINIALVILSGFIVSTVYSFPAQVLWILGDAYSDLQKELVLNVLSSCLGLIAGASFSLYTSRGWAITPFLSISLNLLSILIGVLLFDFSSIESVLWFNVLLTLVQVIINVAYCSLKIVRL